MLRFLYLFFLIFIFIIIFLKYNIISLHYNVLVHITFWSRDSKYFVTPSSFGQESGAI